MSIEIKSFFHILRYHKLVTNPPKAPIIIPRQCGCVGRILDAWMQLSSEGWDFLEIKKDMNLNVFPYTKYREIMLLNKKYIIPKYNKNFKKKVIDEWLEKLK